VARTLTGDHTNGKTTGSEKGEGMSVRAVEKCINQETGESALPKEAE